MTFHGVGIDFFLELHILMVLTFIQQKCRAKVKQNLDKVFKLQHGPTFFRSREKLGKSLNQFKLGFEFHFTRFCLFPALSIKSKTSLNRLYICSTNLWNQKLGKSQIETISMGLKALPVRHMGGRREEALGMLLVLLCILLQFTNRLVKAIFFGLFSQLLKLRFTAMFT